MFCTLCLKENKRRFCRNLLIETKKIGDIEFINAIAYKKSAIKKLEKKLKNKVDIIILSENLKKLEFKNIEIYSNEFYLKNIAKYTFINIIRLSKIPTNKLSVCICDENLEHEDFIYTIANKASLIKIVTNNDEKAETISENMYNDLGVSPVVTNSNTNADLGIDLNYNNPRIWFNTPENFAEITPKCIKLGAGLKGYIPKGISECDFAGVLQEYNDFKRLKLLHADRLVKNEKYFKINQDNIKNFLDINDDY